MFLARARSVAGFEKTVALKMIHPTLSDDAEFTQGLIEEANITSQLSHKNIVQVIDLGQIDGLHYIAMEYVDGIDLGRFLMRLQKSSTPISPRVAAYVMREVCEGLDHAHRKAAADGKPLRIVHRDVSPGNVLLSFSGEVKLSDFGMARASLRAAATQAGEIKGKYNYMSPEQARGTGIDPRADVFGAGTVLYEMVTGQCAYPNAPLPILLQRVNRALIEPAEKIVPGLPKPLTDIIKRATEADPNNRYASARAMVDALTEFLYSMPPGADAELSRMLEETAEDERDGSQPMGAILVEDSSDDVTQIETSAQIRAKFLVAKPPRPLSAKTPAARADTPPEVPDISAEWGPPTEPELVEIPEAPQPVMRAVSSATPRPMPEDPNAPRRVPVRAPTLAPTGLRLSDLTPAAEKTNPSPPPEPHAFDPEAPTPAIPIALGRQSLPHVIAPAAQPPSQVTGQLPAQPAPSGQTRSQRLQLIAASVLALFSVLALVAVLVASSR